jgi:hypothetical protein
VTPGNLGDGTMSVNIAGSTTNPDFSTDINSSCSVSVNALAQSSLTMDKNTDDCAANVTSQIGNQSNVSYSGTRVRRRARRLHRQPGRDDPATKVT